jgi:hypothetical protein
VPWLLGQQDEDGGPQATASPAPSWSARTEPAGTESSAGPKAERPRTETKSAGAKAFGAQTFRTGCPPTAARAIRPAAPPGTARLTGAASVAGRTGTAVLTRTEVRAPPTTGAMAAEPPVSSPEPGEIR